VAHPIGIRVGAVGRTGRNRVLDKCDMMLVVDSNRIY